MHCTTVRAGVAAQSTCYNSLMRNYTVPTCDCIRVGMHPPSDFDVCAAQLSLIKS